MQRGMPCPLLHSHVQWVECGDPGAYQCGATIESGIVLTGLDLVDGERYHVCIRIAAAKVALTLSPTRHACPP